MLNLNKYKSVEIHWMALYVNGYNVTYFEKFYLNTLPKKLENLENFSLVGKLGIKAPLSKIPLLGDILFYGKVILNKIINKFFAIRIARPFLLDKSGKLGFTCSVLNHLLKLYGECKNLKNQEIQGFFQNKLDKVRV